MVFFEVLQIIFGSIVLLFLPGFVWSYALFKKHQIDIVDRVVLSIGLSMAFVPLTVLVLNYTLDVQINLANFLFMSVAWATIPLAYFYMKKLLKKAEK